MKKLCVVALLLCSLLTGTAYAKDVYYESFTDAKTGRRIEYIDLNEDTTRPYFTQNMWFTDNNSFIIGGESDHQIYRYDVSKHTVEELFDTSYLPLDSAATVGPDDTVYARNSSNGNIYAKEVDTEIETVKVEPLYMELPLATGYENNTASNSNKETATSQQYTSGGLTFGFYTNDRWNEGMSLARQKAGKWCRTTLARNSGSGNGALDWYEIYNWDYSSVLRSTFLSFKVDSTKISSDTTNITIEFDYFDTSDSGMSSPQYVELTYLTTTGKATKRIAYTRTDTWKTARFDLTDAKFDQRSGGLQGGYTYDFRIGSGGNRGGLAVSWVKVYPTPVSDVTNLGYAQGGWHPHVSSNGDLSLTTGEAHKIVIYEANKGQFATTDVWNNSQHAIINPVYPHLVLYSYDNTGDANLNHDRIRLFNRNTMFKGCIFSQYKNSSNGATTGEAVGHESWSLNGEYIVAVKYRKDTNVGKSGIIRMDKNGQNREYINDDYKYWHCAASPDGRWIVADTEDDKTNIVLIDAKTGKSYLLARQQLFWNDPGQPHPSFSADGNYVTFAMARRKLNSSDEDYVIGVGIIDVSDIVNDGQIAEPAAPTDFSLSPFEIKFDKTLNKNEVTTTVDNIDGVQRNMNLYAAVFSGDRLVSVNKGRYNSSSDGTLSAELGNVNAGETVKCFLWDDNAEPIKSSTDTIKMLRGAKVGPTEIDLTWQHDTDMEVLKYEVFRDNEKIGETPYTVYRDSGLTKETNYTYYVRPVYNAFHVGEDGASVTVNANELNLNGTNYGAPSTTVAGPKAGIKVKTSDGTMSSTFAGSNITETGMQFVYNPADSSKDGYTTTSNKGSKDCRKITSDATSMFCFKLDKSIVPEENDTAVDITVSYYNNGSGDINILYPATDGTTKTAKVASLSSFGFSWKTATVSITDAKFDASLNRNADFVIKVTKGSAYLDSVSVVKKSASPAKSERQYVEWSTSTGADSGLTRTSGGTVDGNLVSLSSSADYIKFSIDDTYMYGVSSNMAWVDVTYKDQGTGKIYLYYNTSDPTATDRESKQAQTAITCTNTGELKTARIALIDAGFVNKGGYDFKIGTDSSAYISSVQVVGY